MATSFSLADGGTIKFGADEEVTLTHVHDIGLTITNTISDTDNKPVILQLKSEEDDIVADDVIASIEFAAGDSDGTDGATVAAGIHAIAEGTFAEDANATKLVFTTGESETAAASATAKMTLTSAGNLGIGITDPDQKLVVNGDLRLPQNYAANGVGKKLLFHSASAFGIAGINYIGGPSGNEQNGSYLNFFTDDSNRMTILKGGNVGIGTNNPGRPLHIYDTSAYPHIRLTGYTGVVWDVSAEQGGFVFYHPYGSIYYKINNNNTISTSSDDRLKTNEEYITGALDTIMKLKPQVYNMIIDGVTQQEKTPGLIAQDIYYDCPELRYLVTVPEDAVPGDKPVTSDDPSQDPDYSNWGSTYAGLNYSAFQIYLIKAVQEQQTVIEAEKAKVATLETELAAIKTHLGL